MHFEHLGDGLNNKTVSKQEMINANKKISKMMAEAKKDCKLDKCYNCNKPTTSFCNSHFVPRFCLENIGINGEVVGPNSILELPNTNMPIMKEHMGINASGTFQIICRDCDSKIFRDYENPDNYVMGKNIEQKILAQIAMKNYLKFISKRRMECALYEKQKEYCKTHGITDPYYRQRQEQGIRNSVLDLQSYEKSYKKACKIAASNDYGYYVIFYKILEYVCPIAVQAPISLAIDLEGNVVSDIFNMDPNYDPTEMHLCVFPLKTQTVVLLFIKDGDKKYRKFYKQFRKLNEDDQLSVLNYIIFLYCEDYFLARDIEKHINLEELKDVANRTPVVWDSVPKHNTDVLSDEFSLTNHKSIPNLLSEKNRIR